MANNSYFLKSADGLKMYRIEYVEIPAMVMPTGPPQDPPVEPPPPGPSTYVLKGVYITGEDALLPDATTIDGLEAPTTPENALIEIALNTANKGTRAEYRTLVKSIIDSRW